MFNSRCPACGRLFVEPEWRRVSTLRSSCHCPCCGAGLRLSPAAQRRMQLPGVLVLLPAGMLLWQPFPYQGVLAGLGLLLTVAGTVYAYGRREYHLANS